MKELIKRITLLLLFFGLFCQVLFAQVVDPIAQDTLKQESEKKELAPVLSLTQKKEQLVQEIKKLSLLDSKDYVEKIDPLKVEVSQFLDNKKNECRGEFSSMIINDLGETEMVKRKLTKEESKLCFHELKIFNAFYISQMIEVRKNFLKSVYNQQVEGLEKIKDKLLEDMEERFSQIEKQTFKKRRRR